MPTMVLLEIEKRFQIDTDEVTSSFEKELQKRLNKKGRFYLGA